VAVVVCEFENGVILTTWCDSRDVDGGGEVNLSGLKRTSLSVLGGFFAYVIGGVNQREPSMSATSTRI
jgi:hypothetical protein